MFGSLRVRLLVIFISLAVIPLLLVALITGRQNFTSLEKQSLALQHEIAAKVAAEINSFIRERENELFLLEIAGLEDHDRNEQLNHLNQVLFHRRHYQEVTLLDAAGQEQIRLSRTQVVAANDLKNRADSEAYLFSITHQQNYFSPVFFDETIREPLLTIGVPFVNRLNGIVDFIVVADVRFKRVWDLLVLVELPTEGDVYVINQLGKVVAHRNPTIVLSGVNITFPTVDGRGRGLSGSEVIFATEPLTFGDQVLQVVAEQPVANALEVAINTRQITIAVTSAAVIAAIVLVSLATRQIVKPVEALVESALAISQGDFSKNVEIAGPGEIKVLASTFRAMSEQVQQLVTGLRQEIVKHKETGESLKAYSDQLEVTFKQLQEAQAQLIRQEKLAVLGQMAGSVGHELRNPLGTISNAVYFLRMVHAEADETTNEYLSIIENRVREVDKIVSDLLNLSRTRSAERKNAAVDGLVAEVLDRNPAPESVAIVTDVPSDLPAVFVDPQQIGQVLTNLVTNAYQAMPEGGELGLKAHTSDDYVCLVVADTGPGIAPETMERVFEPLFTTKSKGIGLGLVVSKNLVELNGGQIEVESVEGKGAIFTLTLPTKDPTSKWLDEDDVRVIDVRPVVSSETGCLSKIFLSANLIIPGRRSKLPQPATSSTFTRPRCTSSKTLVFAFWMMRP